MTSPLPPAVRPARPETVGSAPTATRSAIYARGLTRRFQSEDRVVEALRGIDLDVRVGEAVAVMGRSGAGKSTLLNLIGALDRGYGGELQVFGQEVRLLPDRALARFRNRQIGFVFQAFNLLPNLSVGDNILLPGSFGTDLDDVDLRARARRLLADMDLGDRFDQRPMQMSGGERQRVAIARALLLEPPLLVCDEPTGSLDGQTAQQILRVLQDIRARFGTTLVLVTHDPTVAEMADRVVTLDRGRLLDPTATEAVP
jgi:putative ABC transport system ATP-binding protein